jgi:uncharacterized phiE125 gp8 family phage protein
MTPSWVRTVDPTLLPIDLADAKLHMRMTQDTDDAAIQRCIKVATQTAEDYMSRGLLTQTWKLVLREFADTLYLPMAAPLQSVTSVKYYDANGTLQTLANTVYDVDTVSRPGRVTLAFNQVWPTTVAFRRAGRVEITYVVGWTAATAMPERIKQGIRMYVAYLSLDREGLEMGGEQARKAAEACWDDRVRYIEPTYSSAW